MVQALTRGPAAMQEDGVSHSATVLCAFDTSAGSWLPEVMVDDCQPASGEAPADDERDFGLATMSSKGCRLSSDNCMAAAAAHEDHEEGADVQLVSLIVFSVPQLAFRVVAAGDVRDFAWLPEQHALFLLGPGRIARLAVDDLSCSSSPAAALSAQQAGPKPPCMDLLSDCAAAVIVQSRGSQVHDASQATYSVALSFQFSSRFLMPAAALPAGTHASVHCSSHALAVCFGSLPPRPAVHALHAGRPVPMLFYAGDLRGVSWSHGYLAGFRTQAVEGLDGCRGCTAALAGCTFWHPAVCGASGLGWPQPAACEQHA